MNNRLDELFGQATDWAVPETWSAITHVQLARIKEEFSRLVIRECLSVCEQVESQENTASACHTAIERRFKD